MATLHGILAELGIETPAMHPEREVADTAGWVVDRPFLPEMDASYEIVLGDEQRHLRKTVRIDGPDRGDWFDLEQGAPLEPALRTLPVRAFRHLGD